MKSLSQFLVLLLVSAAAHCQGTIWFSNLAPGLDAPIMNAIGQPVPPSAGYAVELLAGPDPCCLAPVGNPIQFSSAGYFGLTDSVRVIPGMETGSHPWFEVRCWRLGAEVWIPEDPPPYLEFGTSEVFQLDPAGPGLGQTADDAPVLSGLSSFGLGVAVRLWMGTEAGNVVIQWLEDPLLPQYLQRTTSMGDSWQVLSNAVSPHVESVSSGSPVFFRIVAQTDPPQANQAVEATQPRSEISHDQ
jgi:hypothetical protein